MGNYSRDSFVDTKNALNELLGLTAPGDPGIRNYVGVRLQQAVPMLDADWNEEADIRRLELEFVLARAIGNGVPAGSDGFKIASSGLPNNFSISAGIIFANGWLVYNRATVNYDVQPYRTATGVAPPVPNIQPPAIADTELVYLDAWEAEVSSQEDTHLVDNRIGIETCVRLERLWVARITPLATNANPLDPNVIPNRQAGHRYYPLATVKRPASSQITDGMINDLRRVQLSLDALTHAPLSVYDPVRDQQLDSNRLALAFRGNLDALQAVLKLTPEVFVYSGHPVETAQSTTLLQDVRAQSTTFEQQARAGVLYREAAFAAMQSFFNTQNAMIDGVSQFATAGLATGFTSTFLTTYKNDLRGVAVNDPNSMKFALSAGDLIGAVMAQERLNQDLGAQSNTLPEGTVALSLISVTPNTNVVANTAFLLTIRVQSFLTSVAGAEKIQVIASAGAGWTLQFQDNAQTQLTVPVNNQSTQDIVLSITAVTGAANTNLSLTARPERRQQLVYQNPPVPLAIGQKILPGTGPIVTMTYQGPTLGVGNIASVPRAAMFGSVSLPFHIASVSGTAETYQITVTAQTPVTGWQPPAQPIMPPLAPGASTDINIVFKTSDQNGAVSPVTYRVELTRVTGGANDPQPNTIFDLTFQLT